MPNLLMIDLEGTAITPIEQDILSHSQVGAVILFERNFESKTQLKVLTDSIRQIRSDIFIAVDQEGGAIQRFRREGFCAAPAAMTYGLAYDHHAETGIYLAKTYGQRIAEELIDCGVDLNFAPVLDLHDLQSSIIGQLDRAFHATPEGVAVLAGAFIDGMHQAGMPAVGKHFPGHGRCVADSHLTLPTHAVSRADLEAWDLQPFNQLIQQKKLDAVMAAHVVYPALDPNYPAGYSKYCLNTLLRDALHFDGLVISDCLSMKGADIGDLPTRAHQAVEAGCELLILCNEPRLSLLNFLKEQHFDQTLDSARHFAQFKAGMRRF